MRSARTPWARDPSFAPPPVIDDFRCEVLIVGAGITGALMAERLTRQGLGVVLIDRESPAQGSTMASTAMLLWEIDRSLGELTQLYGLERAARCYRASLDAVSGLQSLVAQHGLRCGMRPRNSLYLATDDNAKPLHEEFALRSRIELPGDFLDHATLLSTFGIARAGAILSPASADADPVQLTRGLLKISLGRGARLFKANAIAFDGAGSAVSVGLDNDHEIEARHVVLATGYVMPRIVRPTIQQIASSWAIATVPQPNNIWKDGTLIWENSKTYHYARTTADGRIIFGAKMMTPSSNPRPAMRQRRGKRHVSPRNSPRSGRAQGLRLTVAGQECLTSTTRRLAADRSCTRRKKSVAGHGYGGNGITFSYIAAELIGSLIAGGTSPLLEDFALDRDPGPFAGSN